MKKFLLVFLLVLSTSDFTYGDIIIGNNTGVTTKVLGRELCERAVKKGNKVLEQINPKDEKSTALYFFDGKVFEIGFNNCIIGRW